MVSEYGIIFDIVVNILENIMKESPKRHIYPQCWICHIPFDSYYHNPRIVPKCGHTFCQKCIVNRTHAKAHRKTFICPQCHSESTIKKTINEEFIKNLTILELIQTIKRKKLQQTQPKQQLCPKHHKVLQFKCITCNQQLICSYCALLGSHKNHSFSQATHTSQNLTEALKLLSGQIEQTILPSSSNNLIHKCKTDLIEGVKQAIKIYFRQYYQKIQRKQKDILNQCNSLQIKPDLQNSIDSILQEYDMLKIKYQSYSEGENIYNPQQIKLKIDSLLQQINNIKLVSDQQVSNYINELSNLINSTTIIKYQDYPFNLKNIIGKQIQSQQHTNQLNKKKSVRSIKSSIYTENNKQNITEQLSLTNSNHKLPLTNKANKKTNSQIVTMKMNKLSKLKQTGLDLQKLSENLTYNEINVPLTPSVSIRLKDETSINYSIKKYSPNTFKVFKPNKQINYDLRQKLQLIIKEINRQRESPTLQLIGMDINDALLFHILDNMNTRNIKFSMIKLVKNNISDEGFREILNHLQKEKYTKVLNMTSNNLTSKIITNIIQSLQENKILKTIYLSHNKISSFHLKAYKKELDALDIQIIL